MTAHERTVIHADCLGEFGMPSLAPQSVDSLILDPPYGEHVHANAVVTPTQKNVGGPRELGYAYLTDDQRAAVAREAARVARRWTIAFSDVEGVGAWKRDMVAAGLVYARAVPWIKRNAQPQLTGDRPGMAVEMVVCAHSPHSPMRWNGRGAKRIYDVPILDKGAARYHDEQKPLELMEKILADFTDEGELVCDPFAGSGSTLIAAILMGRRAVGFEVDADHVSQANARIALAAESLKRKD